MRPETIEFSGDLPVRAFVRKAAQYPYHWHNALEIIYVLQGQAYIGMGAETNLLEENDIAVVNVAEIHRINKNSADNKLLIMQIDAAFYERVNPDYQCTFFYCCSPYHETQAPEKYNQLKGHVARLVYLLNEPPDRNCQAEVKDCLGKLLSYMTYSFDYLRWGPGTKAFNEKQVERIKQMCRRVLSHNTGKPGLKDLAQEAGVSLYHLSHDIKDKFGYTFQELVHYSMCEKAAKLLLGTNKRIYDVSAESGFSDPKYFIKHFKLNYQCTPSQFRKMHRADEQTLLSQVQYQEEPLSSILAHLARYQR